MINRVFNFNSGPAMLPLEVLEEAKNELINFQNSKMSILEISHRSKAYEEINDEAEANMKNILGLDDNYHVLFLQGGASTQFAMIPLNLLAQGGTADYILTGLWSEKAHIEARLLGNTHIAATTAGENYKRIPSEAEIQLSENPVYVHITSNNTVYGTQWTNFPYFKDVPMIVDMSSDILCRPFNAKKFSLIYAGAQKNLGPAGVTIVIIHKDLVKNTQKNIPTMLRYQTHTASRSLFNTPPVFSVYIVNLVLRWLIKNGGLITMEKRNEEKAALIYDVIDNSHGFYIGHADRDSRSIMNVTFNLDNKILENHFLAESSKFGLQGLKGHRSIGGLRASIYNAMPKEGCEALRDFMLDFQRRNNTY